MYRVRHPKEYQKAFHSPSYTKHPSVTHCLRMHECVRHRSQWRTAACAMTPYWRTIFLMYLLYIPINENVGICALLLIGSHMMHSQYYMQHLWRHILQCAHYIVIIIIKTCNTGPSGKTKLFINSYATPQAPAPRKNWKTNSGMQPTIYCSFKPIYRFGIKHSVRKVIPHRGLGRQETPSKLGRSSPWYFKL